MTPAIVLTFFPLCAVALTIGLVALRLGKETRGGLVVLSSGLAVWATGLILLLTGARIAERVLPLGMLLAGAVLHAGTDVARQRAPRRRSVTLAYGFGVLVALTGFFAPRLLYGEGARGPGPVFLPLAVVASGVTVATLVLLARLVRDASSLERPRRLAVLLSCAFGSLGGGGAIALRVWSMGRVEWSAPPLFAAIALTGYAVFSGEELRVRQRLVQGAVQAVITAALSAVGLTAFIAALPWLLPGGAVPIATGSGASILWLAFVVFVAALPLEPLRMLLVEGAARALFQSPITVPELADRVERTETRADQAERLAALGGVVSAVAHEIRNPLGVIAAQVKLLEKSGAATASLDGIRHEVDRAKRFLDDLLRYGKPRPLDIRGFDARAAAELATGSVLRSIGDGAPRVEFSGEASLVATADRNAFSDVVTILVSNACFAVEGDPDLPPVRVTLERGDRELRLVVEDDGPGVPKEIENALFEPFVTGRGRDAKRPGTGLGLAIAARWLERHGGALSHERRARGTRFVARWPTTD